MPGSYSARPFLEALHAAGYRLTEPRLVVAELIGARKGTFTAADLLDDARARRSGIGRATVFRALDVLADLDVLERIELSDGEHAYVACLPRQHHHHIICEACGRVTEVDDLGVAAALEQIERRTGWQVESHRLELYGRCPHCRDTSLTE
jgi:Fe2+ or Zn2+ uptake regulation protein